MKRKILSLILVFAMTVSLLTVGTGAVEPTYGDTAGHWAESSIERWSGHGIIQGSNGLFDPNGQLTCAQLATILAKLLKLPAAKDAGFTDNTADAWYYDAINRCAAAGILNGNGDGTVTPEAPISRERAMVMLARALGIEPIRKPDLTKYTDAAKVAPYAQGMVAAMIEAGIVGGVTADELAPQDNINRASTVTILDRAIDTYADEAGKTVKADGKGLVLVVADDVTVTGDVDKLLVPANDIEVTVKGSKNIDDITVTGDNSKVILNNSTANDVTLDGKNTELETKSGSKVENVSVTEDAKGATVNAGSGTTIKNVENSAADTTVTGSGTVKNVASDTDITVETKNTNVENSGDEKITVTDAKGKDSTVSATGSGSSTTVNKETTSSGGGGYSHSHSYDTSKWVFDDTKHWHASTCGHNLKIDEAEHTYENDVCTVCGQVKADVAVAKIGSKNYKTLAEAVAAGGDVTLLDNVVVSEPVIVNKTVILNMDGKTISNTTDIWNEATGAWSLISVRNGGDLTITGNGKLQAKANDCFAVDVQGGAKLTIENGTFVGNVHAVYVYQGELTVKGGAYSIQQKYSDATKADEFVLNCYDKHRTEGTAKIIVTGGTFEKFNPANCAAEGTGTNFVAAGYTAKELEGDKYQVVALFASGTGTAGDPFVIQNAEQFKTFRDNVNAGNTFAGKTIELTDDIDLSSVENWVPIGTNTTPFKGVFDGNNKTISNLKITGGGYIGLFGYITGGAEIKNVRLAGADVSGSERVGGLVGQIIGNATVANCSIDAASKVTGNDSNTGGLIGAAQCGSASTISLSSLTNYAAVTNTASSNSRAGGIIGQVTRNANVTITNCHNHGVLSAANGYAGGIVAAYQNGSLTINGCTNTKPLSDFTGAHTADLIAWITSVRALTINADGEVSGDMIGYIESDYSRNFKINGSCYFLNKTPESFTFASALQNKQSLDTARMDRIIDFYTFAKTENSNFETYPNFNEYWEMFTSTGGFGGDGWPQLLKQYNEAYPDRNLKQEEFTPTWRDAIMYFYKPAQGE